MNKIAIAFLAVASLAACGGKKKGADNQKHIDAVCACQNQACVDEYMKANPDAAKVEDPKMKECKDKAMAGGMAGGGGAMAGSGEGGAMAGSGGGGAMAGSGEGGAMAGSGGGGAMAGSGEGGAMAGSGGGGAMAGSGEGGAMAGSAGGSAK